jgi:hypothetical protein
MPVPVQLVSLFSLVDIVVCCFSSLLLFDRLLKLEVGSTQILEVLADHVSKLDSQEVETALSFVVDEAFAIRLLDEFLILLCR